MQSRNPDDFSLAVFPDMKFTSITGKAKLERRSDGIFTLYSCRVTPRKIVIRSEKIKDAAPEASTPPNPANRVAQLPAEAKFDLAATWKISLPANCLDGVYNLFLRINYTGDIGRAYSGSRLLTDNFYYGETWEIGVKRFAPDVIQGGILLKILPLRGDAPIFIPETARPVFPAGGEIVELRSIEAVPEYQVSIRVVNGK